MRGCSRRVEERLQERGGRNGAVTPCVRLNGGRKTMATPATDPDDPAADSAGAEEEAGLDLRGLALRGSLILAAVLAVAAAVTWLPALAPIRNRFADTDPRWVLIAFFLQLASVLSFVVAFRGVFEGRIRWRAAMDLALIEEGANVLLPSGGSGGLAIGAAMMVRAGVPTQYAASRTAVLFLVTSAVSFLAVIIFGTLAGVGVLGSDVTWLATLGPAVVATLVLTAAVVLPRRLPVLEAAEGQRIRAAIRRLQLFLQEAVQLSVEMIRTADVPLLAGAVGYFAFDVASAAAAFAALGHGALPLACFTVAYVLGHGGALIPLPGSAEGGLVGIFAAYGSPLSLTIGAILVYRTFHAGVPTILGLFGYIDLRRQRPNRPPPEEIARRFE